MNDADLLRPANVKAGARIQPGDEERRVAARLPTECWRSMEQELPASQPVQRNLYVDQHAPRSLPEPEADSRQPEPAEVSESGKLFKGKSFVDRFNCLYSQRVVLIRGESSANESFTPSHAQQTNVRDRKL